MARVLRIEYLGAVYHITSRDSERRVIFLDDEARSNRGARGVRDVPSTL